MISIFHQVSKQCSEVTTRAYSTSFSTAIRLLHKDIRQPVYNIYGFVRLADEIVDTFHDYNKSSLLREFRSETFNTIRRGIGLNPILHSFQQTVNDYKIPLELIDAFFHSMEMDLTQKTFDTHHFKKYIYGSAEVVGLMCLSVFCNEDREQYEKLKAPARALGAAFQKVNFLRDIRADFNGLSRMYFPGCDFHNFTEQDKLKIESEIEEDFKAAYEGILNLPLKSRFGVYVAYKYYLSLFRKIKRTKSVRILETRIRIPNYHKLMIVLKAGVKHQIGLIGL